MDFAQPVRRLMLDTDMRFLALFLFAPLLFGQPTKNPGDAARVKDMISQHEIRGRVLDSDDRPVPLAVVELIGTNIPFRSSETADRDGNYRIYLVGICRCRLRARPAGYGSDSAEVTVSADGQRWGLIPAYFPNSVDPEGGMVLAGKDGLDMTRYDIRLSRAPLYRIGGVVLDDETRPVPDAEVRVFSGNSLSVDEGVVTTAENGSFTFPSVRAGYKQISATARWKNTDWVGKAEVSVRQSDVADVQLRVAQPFSVSGSVLGLPPLPDLKSKLWMAVIRSSDARPLGDATVSVSDPKATGGEVQPDGSFTIGRLYPGRYRIGVWPSVRGYYLHSIAFGGQDVTGQDVDIYNASNSIEVIYKPNPPRVRGTVKDGAGAFVIFIEANPDRQIPRASVHTVKCGANGQFTLNSLRPTTYLAFATTSWNVDSGPVFDAVFRLGLQNQGRTVRLSEGDNITLDLDLTPWPN